MPGSGRKCRWQLSRRTPRVGKRVSAGDGPTKARYLLNHGLAGMEGVVFLSEFGKKMILLRAGMRVLSLAGESTSEFGVSVVLAYR